VLWLAAGIVQREFFDISLGLGRLSAAGYLLPASAWCSAMLLCAAESVPAPILHVVVAVQISSASGSSGSSVFFPQQPKVSTSPACA
jgi:hypothetical protein